jgi:hypothetical protein
MWGSESHPNTWVICRAVSSSWAVEYPEKVETILRDLAVKAGKSSQISNALRALARRGLDIEI